MKQLSRKAFARARGFLKNQARPIDRALFEYRFENGPVDAVLDALAAYQNEDGGFGHALEPDMRTPSSSALATGGGLRLLAELGVPAEHAMARKAVGYCLSTYDPESKVWRVVPHDANDHPHAPWWHDEEGSLARTFDDFQIIPRAEIVAYLHHFPTLVPADWLREVAADCVRALEAQEPLGSGGGDDLAYAIELAEAEALDPDLEARLVARIRAAVPAVVCRDPEQWASYCAAPLKIVRSPHSAGADLIADALAEHLDYTIEHQTDEGTWEPNWTWDELYPEVWPQAKLEWRGEITLATLTMLRAFGRIEP
jgi:hypothetical protein